MPELFRSAHQIIEYNPEYSLIRRVLHEHAEDIPLEEFQNEWLQYARLVQTFKPQNILVNASNFRFLLVKEMQDWINSNVVSVFNEIGLKKWAIVFPPQFLNQVSIEQTIDSNPDNTFETRFFETESEALHWLQRP